MSHSTPMESDVGRGVGGNSGATYGAIILAAGRSQRMGQCKTTLPWRAGQSLLAYQTHQLVLGGYLPMVVLGHHCPPPPSLAPGTGLVINHHPDEGKTHSLRLGLAALGCHAQKYAQDHFLDGILISAVDQPRPAHLYQQLRVVHQQERSPILAPGYQGKMGHPILFSGQLWPELEQITEETQGIRAVVQRWRDRLNLLDIPDPQVHWDLNTPEQYQFACQQLGIEVDDVEDNPGIGVV